MELSLEKQGASSWRNRKPHSRDIGSLILDTEGASSWRHREPHPVDIGSLILGATRKLAETILY
jgi:hypothetical protein